MSPRLYPIILVCALVPLSSGCKRRKQSPPSEDRRAALQALPYLSSKVDAEDKQGVTVHDRKRAYPGLNLFSDTERREAYLASMDGEILHTWRTDIDGISHVELRPNGNLIISLYDGHRDTGLAELDWDSNLLWHLKDRCHHDVDVADNGDIYALCRRPEIVEMDGSEVPILNEYLTILGPDGKLKREISLYPLFGSLIPEKFRKRVAWFWNNKHKPLAARFSDIADWPFIHVNSPYDVFHTNTVELARRSIDGVCEPAHVLLSFRHLDLVAVVDPKDERLVWSWGAGVLEMQHTPTFLDNGNLLIFDNGSMRGYSRVVEVDPRKEEIVWQYRAAPPDLLFTKGRGSAQRLPNGNTLIAESDAGRALEVTTEGEKVWEFYTRKRGQSRPLIYRWLRVEADLLDEIEKPHAKPTYD